MQIVLQFGYLVTSKGQSILQLQSVHIMLTGPTVLPGGTSDGVTEPLGHNVSPIPCTVCVVMAPVPRPAG